MLTPRKTSTGTVTIGKVGIKKSAEHGGGLVVDVDLCEDIVNSDEAREVDELVPGAFRLWELSDFAQRNADERALLGMTSVSPRTEEPIDLQLASAEGFVSRPAELKSAVVRATASACIFTLRARIPFVDGDEIFRLVTWLGDEALEATITVRQTVLPFAPPVATVEVDEVCSGRVDGMDWAGMVRASRRENGQEILTIDDCGKVFDVPAASVVGSFTVARNGETGANIVAPYKARAKSKRLISSWVHLIPALGRAYLSEAEHGDVWDLSDSVIDDAIASQLRREAV
ncbi:MAG: hypothetical protein KGS10_05680 [Chloroflexi bacterium]|nr:hypothetical protein [Chloroflexota bacterium]